MIRLIRLAAAAGAAILIAGCGATTHYWCHPTKPMPQAFDKDRYECDGESYVRAGQRGDTGDDKIIKEEWERCMRARGWAPCPEQSK